MLWFRKKEIEEMSNKVETAFTKVHDDMRSLQAWVNHVHDRHQALEANHHENLSLTRRDIQHLNGWIQYLHKHLGGLHENSKRLSDALVRLQEDQKKLHERLAKLETTHFLPLQEASKVVPKALEATPQPLSLANVDSLSASEKAVLVALYQSQKPLRYEGIASRLGLNYTTVKNLIYKIRRKGYPIRSTLTVDGEKEFSIDAQLRLRVSGR